MLQISFTHFWFFVLLSLLCFIFYACNEAPDLEWKMSWKSRSINQDIPMTYAFIYDEAGLLIRDESYFQDTLRKITLYTYDDNGNCIEEREQNSITKNFNPSKHIKRIFDNHNRCEQVQYHDIHNEPSITVNYSYDPENRISELLFVKPNQTVLYRDVFIYDEWGNLTQRNRILPSGEKDWSYSYSFEYIKTTKRKDYLFRQDGTINRTIIYHYDDQGRRIKENYFNGDELHWVGEVLFSYNQIHPHPVMIEVRDAQGVVVVEEHRLYKRLPASNSDPGKLDPHSSTQMHLLQ